jgi:nucleoside-diphosphate-sugar epimerase
MILISGGSGFYGINTARCLAERGEEVLLVQRHKMAPHPILVKYWDKQVKQALGNILDLSFLLGLVKTYKVDSIIHAAHSTSGVRPPQGREQVDPTAAEPLHQLLSVQIIGAINCFEAAHLMDLRRVTVVSSVDLYRGLPQQCDVFNEDIYLPPIAFSEIGNCKRAVDEIGFLYVKTYGLSFASLRLGSNFGPACYPEGINAMVTNALEGKPSNLPMVAPNRRTHSVYAKDSAEATCAVHLAKTLKNYIYNVACGTNPTMQEIADTVKEVIPGAQIKLGQPIIKKADNLENRPQTMDRIKEDVGFVPKTLKQGIEAYVMFVKTGEY